MGKYTQLDVGIHRRISEMLDNGLGLSKAEMIEQIKESYLSEGHSLQDYEDCKMHLIQNNDYIRSLNSANKLRQSSVSFCEYAKTQGWKKFEKITYENLEQFLKYRNSQNLSAWTLSSDLTFCRKIFKEYELNKKDLGLPSRKLSDVRRLIPSESYRPNLYLKPEIQKQTFLCAATGCRRESIPKVCKNDLIFNDKGELIRIGLTEKGAKYREAYVLPQHREEVLKLFEGKAPDEPIFEKFDKNIGYHNFRKIYARDLLSQLENEFMRNKPLFRGEIEPHMSLNTHDSRRYSIDGKYRGHDIVPLVNLSQMLGHNRLDILQSYIRF